MPTTLYDWAAQAAEDLGMPAEAQWVGDRETVTWVLDLARDLAHGVTRPAAPVGAFLAGVAVGLRGAGDAALREQVRGQLGAALSASVEGLG
jgi:Domain of unknown function (DUF6457)